MQYNAPKMRSLLLPVLSIVLSLLAGSVHAQSAAERQAARALGDEALKLYESHDYEAAYDRFDKANRLLQAPTLELYMARCLLGLGKLASAYDHFHRGAELELEDDAPFQFVAAQKDARAALAKLEPRVPKLVVEVEGPTAVEPSVTVDGHPVAADRLGEPLRLNPGEHRIEASAPGYGVVAATVALTEGATEVQRLRLLPSEASDRAGTGVPLPALVAFGVGGVGLVLGIVTGVMATTEADDIKSRCVDNHCPPEDEAQGDEAELRADLSTGGFVVAGLGAAAGLALTLWWPSSEEDDSGLTATVKLGPGHAAVAGTF